jgi:F-type H+-transporting ATPase subunit delta
MAGESLLEKKRIGMVYAEAIYDFAAAQGHLDSVRDDLIRWKEILAENPELISVFDSVLISVQQRQEILDKLSNGEEDFVMRNFLGVLNKRNRLGVLPDIIKAFSDLDDVRSSRIRVKVTTPTGIDRHLQEEIEASLRNYLKKEPMVDYHINPEIIGGFVARAGDLLIDGSIRTQLGMLKKTLIRRGEDEIQSGRDFISHKT